MNTGRDPLWFRAAVYTLAQFMRAWGLITGKGIPS